MVLNVCVPPLEDQERQSRLDQVLSCGLACREVRVVRRAEELELRPGGRLLFALALDGAGQNSEYQRMLARLRLEPGLLEGCTGGLIVDGPGELYTKSTAAELALAMNSAGCALVGRPLVEATGSLSNFRIQAKNLSTDLMGAYQEAVRELAERLLTFTFPACWPSPPPAITPPIPWLSGPRCSHDSPPGGRRRRWDCATGPCLTAPAAPIPCASTSASGGAASMAA